MKTPTAKPSACKMENIAFIPATPGFFIIEPWFDEDDDKKIVEVSLMPIIGWHIKAGCTYPITPFQIEDDGYKCSAILTPEKTVFGHCQDPYNSLQEWITDKNKEAKKSAASAQQQA